jgi:gas vesicle protein
MNMNTAETKFRRKIPRDIKVLPRDDPDVELRDGDFSDTDARKMSPRREDQSTERMTTEAKQTLKDQRDKDAEKYSELREKIDDIGGNIGRLEDDNQRLQERIKEQLQE